jgi:hypothetical protein
MSKGNYITGCTRRLREYGEGIVLSDQCISSIKDVVKSNTYTIIGMSQTGQKDRREMINVLGLNSHQAQMVNFLDVGQGIIRLGGRYPFPQLIKMPFVKPENLSDSELDDINAKDPRMKRLLSMVKPAAGLDVSVLPGIPSDTLPPGPDRGEGQPVGKIQDMPADMPNRSDAGAGISIPSHTSNEEPNKKVDKLHEKAMGILRDIDNRFDVASTVRASDFDLSASAAVRIFKYIEKEQFVDVVRLGLIPGRGGVSKFHILNPKGYDAISKKPLKKSGGTGPTHDFLARYLKKHLAQKGFSGLEMEKNIGGKRIDLVGTYMQQVVGIEICVSTAKTEFINVQKDMDKCDVLIITTPDQKTKARLDVELYKKVEPSAKLKTCVVSKLLADPDNIINNP